MNTKKHAHTNRLAKETSPYLLQHAHNPVDWFPWGEEAFAKARKENKPIFLSIGYSACHWCHVMERESFENEELAKYLNAHYVSIKVDREERPDVDDIYMTAVQMMTGQGGWPLTVFLTPDLQPFYGGTYFPPDEKFGKPSFRRVLESVQSTWIAQPEAAIEQSARLTAAIRRSAVADPVEADALGADLLDGAVAAHWAAFDPEWGGFGRAPKFPPSGSISLMLRQYARTGESRSLEMATRTLDRMARGGMYDQIGGGFHRYSVDRVWLVPHFEKMLYDNALLAQAYLEAWQGTGDVRYRETVVGILDYVLRDLTDEAGVFYSSEDADSEGVEGKFYVWTRKEVMAILGERDGALFCEFYDVTEEGNFEHKNIFNVPVGLSQFAEKKELSEDDLQKRLNISGEKLMQVRGKRVRPGRDDKVLAAWNGMMIAAMARAGSVLGEERYSNAAVKAATFVLKDMRLDGVLMRTWKRTEGGGEGKLPGYLDDYAEVANGLLYLYENTFDAKWLFEADALVKVMVEEFWDGENGGFFYTSARHKNLIVRTKEYSDSAVPSGNSTGAQVLVRLSRLLDRGDYEKKAKSVFGASAMGMRGAARGFSYMLVGLDQHLMPGKEIVIIGREGEESAALIAEVRKRFLPNSLVLFHDPEAAGGEALAKRIPLLEGRGMVGGKATVYVCENRVCKQPITALDVLGKLLDNTP